MRIYFIILSFIPTILLAADIKPFISDGCSAFPDGTFTEQELWLMCCKTHDFAYWQGGTYQERLAADKQLSQCVTDYGEPAIAKLMMAGVRVGGTPYLPTKFRWGYGWPFFRGYKVLTEDELLQINDTITTDNN